MTRVGNNIKIVGPASRRALWRAVFGEVLGGAHQPAGPAFDVYRLDPDGSTVGLEFVEHPLRSDAEIQRDGVWLEFVVEDPAATTAELVDMGLRQLDHAVGGHAYLQLPGGPVFRLVGVKA